MVLLESGESRRPIYPELDDRNVEKKWMQPKFEFEHDPFTKNEYLVNQFCVMKNKKGTDVLSPTSDNQVDIQYKLKGERTSKMVGLHRVIALTFLEIPIEWKGQILEVDHIIPSKNEKDRRKHDNHLSNLQYLTHDEHKKKTRKDNPEMYKKAGRSRSKNVEIIDTRTGSSSLYPKGTIFDSTNEAARVLALHQGSISNSCRKGHWVGQYKFKYIEQLDFEGEEWFVRKDTNPYITKKYSTIKEYSNKGRVKDSCGRKKSGSETTNGVYKRVEVGGKKHYVHRVIFEMHYNRQMSESEVVRHANSPTETRRVDGYERNWLCDLVAGTQSENIQDYHDEKRQKKKRKIEI